jgi:putative membrane protein
MTKYLIVALALAAACQPAGEQPAGEPGVVPSGENGAQGTDDVTGDRAEDGAVGTNGATGTNGTTPGGTQGMPPTQTPGTTPGTTGTTPGTAQTPTPGTGTTAEATQSTTQALQDAHQMHEHQAALARLASTKSQDPGIKAYADQAAREHKQADDKLTELAREKDISLQTADAARYQDQRDTQQRLEALEGPAFDQAYVIEMVEGGDRAIRVVQTVLTSTQDPQVRAYFTELQPIVQGQVDRAKQLRPTPQEGTQ